MKKAQNIKTEITELLKKASLLCSNNISKAHNIDLEDMSYSLDKMVDMLEEIEDFEVYEDEN